MTIPSSSKRDVLVSAVPDGWSLLYQGATGKRPGCHGPYKALWDTREHQMEALKKGHHKALGAPGHPGPEKWCDCAIS